MVKAVYTGDDKRLQGETALLRKDGSKFLLQFDNLNLDKSRNWHEFNKEDFVFINRYYRKKRSLLDILEEVL